MTAALLIAPLLVAGPPPEGPPLFYWGARPAVIVVDDALAPAAGAPEEARVVEVHAALDKGRLVLRFTFDRPVSAATRLPGGAPVSGRLRATLYVDGDADRATGLHEGPTDLRTGAELRLEVGVIAVGEDPEEKLEARALITATLTTLARDGRRRTLWRGDDADNPREVSARGEWLEIRLPAEAPVGAEARLVFVQGDRAQDGRLRR